MRYFFQTKILFSKKAEAYLNHKPGLSLVEKVQSYLRQGISFETEDEYNNAISKLVKIFQENHIRLREKSILYPKEIKGISQLTPLTEKVAWGGVALKKVDVEKNFIKKLLVVNRFGILGFEIHKIKYEKLKILEGVALMLYSNHSKQGWKKGEVTTEIATCGDRYEFLPGDEHGLVALTDLVVEEQSTNNLDDLIFVFKSKQIN